MVDERVPWTDQRVRFCPSCYGDDRISAFKHLRALSLGQSWRPEPRMQLDALKAALVGRASPHPKHNLEGDLNATCMWDCWRRATMLEPLFSDIVKRGVPGDVLEAGVYRGGLSIYMAAMLQITGVLGNGPLQRRLWLCDSFAGMPDTNYTARWAEARSAAGRPTKAVLELISHDRDARGPALQRQYLLAPSWPPLLLPSSSSLFLCASSSLVPLPPSPIVDIAFPALWSTPARTDSWRPRRPTRRSAGTHCGTLVTCHLGAATRRSVRPVA